MTLIHELATLMITLSSVMPLQHDTRALIQQALNEPTQITLENIELDDAVSAITEQTGVKLVMPPDAMKLLPNGPETQINTVQIAGVPLRQGLEELFDPLGMTFAVRDDHVEIVPKEAVRCLGRPPTWEELDTLSEIAAMPLGLDPQAIEKLRPRIQFQVPVPGAWQLFSQAVRNIGAGPGDQVLNVAARQLGWSWCLSGNRIIITPRQEQIVQRLRQPISLRMSGRPLFDVLKAVGREANVDIRIEPAALADLPLSIARNFSLNVYQQPAEDALETIAGYTGLGYFIEPDGVVFFNAAAQTQRMTESPDARDAAADASRAADPYVAKLTVPLDDGTSVEWLIRRSELPEDLRERRARDIQQMIERIRRNNNPGG